MLIEEIYQRSIRVYLNHNEKTKDCNVNTKIMPNTTNINENGDVTHEFSWLVCIAII